MGEKDWMEDAAFADDTLKHVSTVEVSAALQRRILADFDALAARRRSNAATRFAGRLRDAMWPGVPAWQPAALLAFSLMIGLAAGALVPSNTLSSTAATAAAATDQTVASDDTTSALDMYKDL